MGRVVYSMNVSLDGYVETRDRGLEWTQVDEEILRWWNDRQRETAMDLYGRRVWEVMAAYWPTGAENPASTDAMREFAGLWNATPKVVFSSTLERIDGARLVTGDAVAEIARLRDEVPGELSVAGPTLAASLLRAGLVDELRPVVHPVVIGGGTPFLPADISLQLDLVSTRRFASGAVFLGYVARTR